MPIYPSSSTPIDNITIITNAAGQLEVNSNNLTDDITITTNTNNKLAAKPTSITVSGGYQDITYSSNTTLTSDVYANNVTINSGVTVTTNGYNFYCIGSFTNNGTIITGYNNSGGAGGTNGGGTGGSGSYGLYIQAASITAGTINASGQAGGNYNGMGGGGGGGGGGSLIFATNGTYTAGTYNVSGGTGGSGYGSGNFSVGGAGGSTLVAGGAAGGEGASGGNGTNASAPSLTASLIQSWYNNGMMQYLEGSGGGGGGGGTSGNGSPGGAGISYTNSYGGAGGGGGGSLGGSGGTGGSGIVATFSGQPISLSHFTYTTYSQSIKNRISAYLYANKQTTSTTPVTINSLNITPTTTGLIVIRATCEVSNNTVGDGVQVLLYNGSTLLDSDTYTQEGTANNPHYIVFYVEQQFSPPFSQQTYSIQFNAITGGTASCEIKEFSLEEIY